MVLEFCNFVNLSPEFKNHKILPMKKIILSALLLSFALVSAGCKKSTDSAGTTETTPPVTNPNTNTTTTQPTETANTPVEEKKEPETKTQTGNELRDKSGAIRVKFPAGSTEITLDGNVKGFGEKVSYVLEASKGQKLFVKLVVIDPNGNLYINQIISPSGKADGPFGVKTIYPLTESGDWKVVLGESQMAGDPWKGRFQLTLSITNN